MISRHNPTLQATNLAPVSPSRMHCIYTVAFIA